jgi:hypothetical protein
MSCRKWAEIHHETHFWPNCHFSLTLLPQKLKPHCLDISPTNSAVPSIRLVCLDTSPTRQFESDWFVCYCGLFHRWSMILKRVPWTFHHHTTFTFSAHGLCMFISSYTIIMSHLSLALTLSNSFLVYVHKFIHNYHVSPISGSHIKQ